MVGGVGRSRGVPEMVLIADSAPIQVERMFKPKRWVRTLFYDTEWKSSPGAKTSTRSPVITQSGTTDGDGLLNSCRGVRAGIPAVVARSDGEVHPRVDGLVSGIVQSLGHTPTRRLSSR